MALPSVGIKSHQDILCLVATPRGAHMPYYQLVTSSNTICHRTSCSSTTPTPEWGMVGYWAAHNGMIWSSSRRSSTMVWMTMLATLTGSSGLPANETRGRGGGRRGGEGEWMDVTTCSSWSAADWQNSDPSGLLSALLSRETIEDNCEQGYYNLLYVFQTTECLSSNYLSKKIPIYFSHCMNLQTYYPMRPLSKDPCNLVLWLCSHNNNAR